MDGKEIGKHVYKAKREKYKHKITLETPNL